MNNNKRILVVDDDEDILIAAELLLKRHFSQVVTCNKPELIENTMVQLAFDAVLLDMNFAPDQDTGEQGLIWLKRILQIDPNMVVVMITAHGDVNTAVKAMKHGATDFISKPWQNEKVIATLSAAVQLHQSRSETNRLKTSNKALIEASATDKQELLGRSIAMNKVYSMISRAAPTDANVLILGENGTGKELVARDLHQQSLRNDNVFMAVDLGAISETLFESELFGHKKGAFTGADKDRIGRLVAANGGTLFLDEIGNIPLFLQAKLLTVLEQRHVTPLGSNQSINIDVRVIAATNITREALSDEKKFRQDLLFRLNTVEITVPPLRQRSEDIPQIANYYAELYARKYRHPLKQFSTQAMEVMQNYDWPGNVRALRHMVERAVILSESAMFEVIDLQLPTTLSPSEMEVAQHSPLTLDTSSNLDIESMDKRMVELALSKHQYNISKAAKELGLTRATLYRRIEKYGF